ncbi:hypothetical protein [Bryobacter aggregatus]|uniref:hypothetical protein n=1 Tax=Bryobacter aggregatus TaxID=360054 RepID=UPI0004E289F5|nr:hypothetical protein [Bryobacter aggregatus]
MPGRETEVWVPPFSSNSGHSLSLEKNGAMLSWRKIGEVKLAIFGQSKIVELSSVGRIIQNDTVRQLPFLSGGGRWQMDLLPHSGLRQQE